MADRTVMFTINELGEGGAQRSALTTAAAWPASHGRCIVVAAEDGPYRVMVPPHLEIHVVGTGRPIPFGIFRTARGIRCLTAGRAVDVVFAHTFALRRLVPLMRVLGLVDVGVVVVEHNTLSVVLERRYPNRALRAAVRILTRTLYRRADAIIGVSDGVSRDLETTLRLPPGTVTTIHNPLDVDIIRTAIDTPVPAHLRDTFERLPRPIVLTTGRLVPQKGHHDLIDAFAALPDHHRGSLVILGEGPLRDALEQHATRLGITHWMPGFVDNPWWFTARADLFCLPSHHEGHPMVLLEALACHTPIVATDCPSGPREILTGIPGTRLVPVNTPTALTTAITHTLTDPTPPHTDLTPYHPTTTAQHYATITRHVTHRRRTRP